jgi:hypothetical protein
VALIPLSSLDPSPGCKHCTPSDSKMSRLALTGNWIAPLRLPPQRTSTGVSMSPSGTVPPLASSPAQLVFIFIFFFLNQFIFRNTCPRQSPVVTKNRYSIRKGFTMVATHMARSPKRVNRSRKWERPFRICSDIYRVVLESQGLGER